MKLPLYARMGIREVWLVDLVRDQVHVHRNPAASAFRTVDVRGRGARLELGAFPDLSFSVDELLG